MRLGSFKIDVDAATLLQRYKLSGYSANTYAIEQMSLAIETLKKYQDDNDLIAIFVVELFELISYLVSDPNKTQKEFEENLEVCGAYVDNTLPITINDKSYTVEGALLGRKINIPAFVTHADTGAVFPQWKEICDALSIIDRCLQSIKPEVEIDLKQNQEAFITKIEIEKVRHLENLTITLSETKRKHLILTGKNGSGKTTLLLGIKACIATGKKFATQSMPFDVGQSKLYNDDFIYSIFFPDGCLFKKDRKFQNKKTGELKSFIDAIILYIPAHRPLEITIPKSIETIDINKEIAIDVDISKDFLRYMIDLDYQKLSAESEGNKTEEERISKWFERFVQTLRNIYESSKLELKKDAKNKIFKIVLPDREFGLDQMSDGYSALLKIVMELMMRMESKINGNYDMQGIVLIDEIETHLHVELQKKVLPFLTTMFPNIQFIVTTHSPFVITSLSNAVVYDLEKQKKLEDLSAYSYDSIVEYYYDVDMYSEKIKRQFDEYKTLATKNNLSPDESMKFTQLITYLNQIPPAAAPEIVFAFRELEECRKDRHG